MSAFSDRVANHPVFASLSATSSLLVALRDQPGLDPTVRISLDRLEHVISFIQRTISQADPDLVAVTVLEGIRNSLDQMNASVAGLASDPPNRAIQANVYADQALGQLAPIYATRTLSDVEGVSAAVARLRGVVQKDMARAAREVSAVAAAAATVQTALGTLTADIAAQRTRLDTAISTFQQQFSDAQAERAKELLAAQKQLQDDHAMLLVQSASRFTDLMARLDEDGDGQVEAIKQEHANFLATTRGSVDTLLSNVKAEHAKAVELVGIIAQTGMVGGFQKVADAQRKLGTTWNLLAVGCFSGLFISALIYAQSKDPNDFLWQRLAAHIFTSLTFAALATFAAQRASNHRHFEQESRRMELELASLGPFLNELDPADRNAIYKQVAEKMFARHHVPPQSGAEVHLPSQAAVEIVNTAIKAFQK